MRSTPQFIVLALVVAAVSGCSSPTTEPLMAPGAPSAVKSTEGTASMTYTSAGGVTATTYDGNTRGEGNSSCSALDLGSTGTKIDGAYSSSVSGYRFTVSSSKQSLAFAPIAGTTPTTLIRAVIVKGGPAYNVYRYSGQTSDAGLTSPLNGGGNIPTISHYVVCYGPGTPPPVGTFTKRLVDVLTLVGDQMPSDPVWLSTGNVVIPAPETRWLDFELAWSLPPGVTGVITENETQVCSTMGEAEVNHPGNGMVVCSFAYAAPAVYSNGILTWSGVQLNGSVRYHIDITTGGVFCGKRTLVNTATLKLSNGQTLTSTTSTPIEFTKGTTGICTST